MTKNFDLKKINLDLTKELNQAGQIIKEDHFQRLDRGQGVDGPMIPSQKKSGKTFINLGLGIFLFVNGLVSQRNQNKEL